MNVDVMVDMIDFTNEARRPSLDSEQLFAQFYKGEVLISITNYIETTETTLTLDNVKTLIKFLQDGLDKQTKL